MEEQVINFNDISIIFQQQKIVYMLLLLRISFKFFLFFIRFFLHTRIYSVSKAAAKDGVWLFRIMRINPNSLQIEKLPTKSKKNSKKFEPSTHMNGIFERSTLVFYCPQNDQNELHDEGQKGNFACSSPRGHCRPCL